MKKTTATAQRLMSTYGHAFILSASNGHMYVSRLILRANEDLDRCRRSCVSSLLASSAPIRNEILSRTVRESSHRMGHSLCYCNVVVAAACSQVQSLLAMLLSCESRTEPQSEIADVHENGAAIRTLQDLGQDINTFTDAAAKGDNILLNRMLPNLGVDVQDGCGWSALHKAATSGHAEIVRWLLEDKRADPHLRLVNGSKAIHCAAQRGHTEVVSLHVENGSCVDERNWFHRTPLHCAVEAQRSQTTAYLLERGADSRACTIDDMTPVRLALKHGNEENGRLLASCSESPMTLLHPGAQNSPVDQNERKEEAVRSITSRRRGKGLPNRL